MLGNKRFLRHLPPTAVPLKSSDFWGGLTAYIDSKSAIRQFKSAIEAGGDSSKFYLVSSGRAGLALILMGLKRLSKSKKVVVPAYICPTVVQSVLRADLEPVFCDVSPQTLDLDRDALSDLINDNLLAVITAHLYGWAQDVRDIIELGKKHGFFVVEDAAQAYGANLAGRMVGTWGDAGIYSLGRGKCIPVGHGGVIVSQEWCSQVISEEIALSISKSNHMDFSAVILFMAYGLLTKPTGWWILSRTRWNPADYGMDVEKLPPVNLGSLSAAQAGIGASLLARLNDIQLINQNNAKILRERLAEFDFVKIPQFAPESEPVFLRLPIVVDNAERADRLFEILSREGIGVSRSYWRTIPELFSKVFPSNGRDYPGASCLANCLLTLPTHAYLRQEDFEIIVSVFREEDCTYKILRRSNYAHTTT